MISRSEEVCSLCILFSAYVNFLWRLYHVVCECHSEERKKSTKEQKKISDLRIV